MFLVASAAENCYEFAGCGKQVSWLHIYIGYGTLAPNTQLMLIIFDGLSIVIGTIDADYGGSIDMACLIDPILLV